jgi:rod shape-determining protein MreD
MITLIRYTVMFVLLLCLQIFVLDNIFIFREARPVVFFFFILVLPRFSRSWLMVIAFLMGLFYDIFYQTYGVHAFALVLIAFLRDPVLNTLKSEEEGIEGAVHISYLGFARYFYYIFFISLIFHLCVTFLIVFSFSEVGNSLVRAGIGTVLSVILIYLLDILFFYRKAAE